LPYQRRSTRKAKACAALKGFDSWRLKHRKMFNATRLRPACNYRTIVAVSYGRAQARGVLRQFAYESRAGVRLKTLICRTTDTPRLWHCCGYIAALQPLATSISDLSRTGLMLFQERAFTGRSHRPWISVSTQQIKSAREIARPSANDCSLINNWFFTARLTLSESCTPEHAREPVE